MRCNAIFDIFEAGTRGCVNPEKIEIARHGFLSLTLLPPFKMTGLVTGGSYI